MTATPEQAIASCVEQSDHGPRFDYGMCLQRVRMAYGVAAREQDAAAAWALAEHKHPTTDPRVIPRGVPVFWTGGSSRHGHIAISAGDGFCWSTDIRRTGYFDRVPIAEIHAKWGLTLVGWTEDVNGVRVWTKPPVTTRVTTANIFKGLDRFKAAHALAEVLALDPDVGGLQEWASGRDGLLKAALLYDFARNTAGGGPVFWRRDRYGLVHCRAVTLARRSFVGHLLGRKSTLPASVATVAVLCDDETSGEVTVVNFHLTAEVQSGGRYRTDTAHRARVRRHKREVRKLGRVARRHLRMGRRVYLVGDTNFHGLTIPGLTSCWSGRKGRTLGSRAVDVVFAEFAARKVRTVTTGSDHRAVIATY